MQFLWFLLGLATGLLCLSWYYIHLNFRLRRSVQALSPEVQKWALSSTSKLTRAIATSLTKQQLLEQDLEVWRQIFHVAPIGLLQVDRDNQLIECNPKARQLLDIQQYPYPKPRLLLELVRSYELDQLIEQTRQVGYPCQREWTFHPVSAEQSILSQQQPRPLRGHGFPLANGTVGVFLESRQEAVLLAQQRDRWTSDVAHELKTPLTSIRLVAETLQPRVEPPLRNWVDRLLQETIRLGSLVQDLLDLSQLQARPASQLKLQPVELVKLIQSAWFSLEPLARSKSLELDYSGPDSLVLQADEPRLHRVLLNLFDNSIKYSPAQQAIQVRLNLVAGQEAGTQQVHLEIIDAGPGFPEAALPHVFERFYRADPSRTRSRYGLGAPSTPATDEASASQPSDFSYRADAAVGVRSGSGLGLAIVQQIVEVHQGTVQASNHAETGGAWLQVFLPWNPPEQRALD